MQKPGPDGAAGTARPLSVAPAQWEECPLLVNFCANVPRGRRATAALPKMSVGGVFVSCPILVWDRLKKVLGREFVPHPAFKG